MKFLHPFKPLFFRRRLDREMAEEMRAHVEAQTELNLRAGMSPDEARYAAQREFGHADGIKEAVREHREGFFARHLALALQDLRHGFRLLGRAPGFAAAAIVSLGLGIGAVTAMLSLVDGIILQPLSYPEADRLVTLWTEGPAPAVTRQPSTLGSIADWRQARSLAGIAAYDPASIVLTEPGPGSDGPRRSNALLVTPNYGVVLGVQPAAGRLFTEEEAMRRAAVAVISATAWRREFGGRPDVVGQRIGIDGRTTEIVGVLPEGADEGAEFWLPHTFRGQGLGQLFRGGGPWRAVARLAPGATPAAAQAELTGLAASLQREYPAALAGLGVRLVPLAEIVVGRETRTALWLLLAAVGAVLLIACSNAGNLLLARALTRQREFALRLSLGATRGRLLAQLLVENLALCGLAAALGAALAAGAIAAVRTHAPGNLPRLAEVTLQPDMLGLALVLALASVSAFGLIPLLPSLRGGTTVSREGRSATASPLNRRLGRALVVAECALAVLLFAGAGMLLRSFQAVLAVDPGYRTENVLFAAVRLAAGRDQAESVPFATTVVERVGALPGVLAVAISEEVMLGERGQQAVGIEDTAGGVLVRNFPLANDAVTAGYLDVLGVALRAGRFVGAEDTAGAPPVVVLNETLARQLWPDGNALGRRLRLGPANSTQPWVTVVGIVADQRRQGLDRAPIAQAFWPLAQRPSRGLNVLVRTAVEATTLAPAFRRAVREVDPTVSLEALTTLQGQIERSLAPRWFHTGLLTTFAAVGLVLAGVGIFGLMHYSVARRTREIGVRTALGASSGRILRQVLGEGLLLAGAGVALGLVGAVTLSRAFGTLLYDVAPTDPLSLAAAGGGLVAVAALASLLPARRAAKVDPMVALRAE